MIPIKIQIKNFLSYGPLQTINFEPYHLIALSGKNGHGKSALLDAITWALWGQARKTAGTIKPDAQLLKLGQNQMMIIFDFESGNTRYRIRREFTTRYGKPYASVDIGIINSQEDKFEPLTDKTIKDTQSVIDRVIGLDYDAFINSAFLRQGQSNEFSKKTPKERKEILGTIIGLHQYEDLRKIASDRGKQLQQHLEMDTKILERISTDLQQYQTLESAEQILALTLENLQLEENALKKTAETVAAQKQLIMQHAQDRTVIKIKLNDLERLQESNQNNLRALLGEWRNVRRLFWLYSCGGR